MKRLDRQILLLFFLGFSLSSCRSAPAERLSTLVATAPAVATPPPTHVFPTESAQSAATHTPVPSATPLPTPTPWRVGAAAAVPVELVQSAQEVVAAHPERFTWVETEPFDLLLTIDAGQPLAQWIYAVAVSFATVEDEISLAELQAGWQEGSAPEPVVTAQGAALLELLWGPGNPTQVEAAVLNQTLWQRAAWSIVPFHRLTPDLKVLRLDGISPLDPEFSRDAYPLAVQVGLTGEAEAVAELGRLWTPPPGNRDPARMSRVALTGVTALVRATAYQMEIRNLLYPGEEVAPFLQEADIVHVSNEVSFVYDCPLPHYLGDPVFCSDPRYLALLEALGVDVVELTGNHLNDWGAQYIPYSLALYDEAGMLYFGGGRDLADAQAPAVFEHNGNKIAFVGCNPVGPAGAWATAERGGANPCNYEEFYGQIARLDAEGYLVIATQQYWEIYHYAPTAEQRAAFRAIAEAGAAAVSGSQGHHAQGFDFHDGAFIHYGLGNLFFDQMDRMGTRQTFVDRYTIYDGRLLNVELWTGLIENYARPRLMTAEERAQLLQTVFEASGWQ